MGLLKETMHAIIRIDQNITAIRKTLTKDNDKWYRANYQQKSIEQICSDLNRKVESELSLFDRLPQLEEFPYPDHLTFGGRLKAVRMFVGLTQAGLAGDLGVTPPHISNLEADKSEPSAMLIRSVSMRYGIDEQWLATSKIEVRGDEVQKLRTMMGIVSPSGHEHEEDMPSEIMIDFGRDRGLLPVQRSPLVDKNISQENI